MAKTSDQKLKSKNAESPGPRASRRREELRDATARLFYRATGIEGLDQKHPGLKAFVEECLEKRVGHADIIRRAREQFHVELSSAGIRRHWQRRVQPEAIRSLDFKEKAEAKTTLLRREAERLPGGDASKIIDALIAAQILEDQLKLGEADVMQLVTEQRRRKEVEIKAGHLEVAVGRLENEKKELDARLEAGRLQREQILRTVRGAETAAAEGKPFDPDEVYAKIAAVIAGDGEAEERVEKGEV